MIQAQILDVSSAYDPVDGAVLEVYGITPEGENVEVTIDGFRPYFYVNVLPGMEIDVVEQLWEMGLKTELVQRYEPIGYQTKTKSMIKVTAKNPKDVRYWREKVLVLPGITAVYEADMLFKNRFLADHDLGGMSWIEVPGSRVKHSLARPAAREDNAPLKLMTFDIECLSRDGQMPTPDKCPTILISLAFSPAYNGIDNMVLMANDVFCPRPDVKACTDEKGMIKRFLAIMNEFDPDVVAGYNSNGFDFEYLDKRCKVLHLNPAVSRNGTRWFVQPRPQGGNRVSITGRVVVDMLPVIRANHSLKQYNLKTVAHELLKKEKLDVPPKEMASLWYGELEDLVKFVKYARRDAVLVMDMLKELKPLEKYIALAKVSGLLLQDVLDGGQSGMVENLLLRKFKARNRVLPMKPREEVGNLRQEENENLAGGFVLDPETGLQEDVAILDYKSLYPTIMIAHNLCFSTVLLDRAAPEGMTVITSPHGGMFVSHEVYKGIIPEVLEWLLDQRLQAKKAMKASKIDSERDLLDAKQYAYKILLNSFYGYSGYARARLYCLDVANAVTSFGRSNIQKTVELIKDIKRVQIKNGQVTPGGYQFGLDVIYGDTDSLFIRIKGCDVDADLAKLIGQYVAARATEKLPPPMELVFEAFAKRSVFLAKKRYAMWRFEEQGGEWKDKIKAKGIETVRRDWCDLTSETLKTCLEMILKQGNTSGALALSRETIGKIRAMDLQKDQDILPKITLTKKYGRAIESYKQKQPHIQLIKKLQQRGMLDYGIGDRIPYIIVRRSKKTQFVDRAEDPQYAIAHGDQIDAQYYIDKQILPPLSRLFGALGVEEDKLKYNHTQSRLCNAYA